MNKWLITSGVMLSLLSANSYAVMGKRYVATPQQSQWEMVVNTPLECQLVHPIPSFGDAVFSSRASKKINLDFELKMRRPMGETRNVSLISMPPPWRPGEHADRITNLKFFKQFDGYVGGQTAWGILSELEKGRYPTFSYQDWQSRDQRIEVALSSVLFQSKYNAFSDCIANLLKYSFEDIAFTILHYERQGDQLTKASKSVLLRLLIMCVTIKISTSCWWRHTLIQPMVRAKARAYRSDEQSLYVLTLNHWVCQRIVFKCKVMASADLLLIMARRLVKTRTVV